MEVWKEYQEGTYISNMGRVVRDYERNKFNPRLSLPTIGNHGYRVITNKVSRKPVLFHRILGELFIPNSLNKRTIDHINRNKLDNRVVNLRWATYSEQNNNRSKEHYKTMYLNRTRDEKGKFI